MDEIAKNSGSIHNKMGSGNASYLLYASYFSFKLKTINLITKEGFAIMKNKQSIGAIIAALVILITGIVGVVSNVVESKIMSEMETSENQGTFFSSDMFGAMSSDVILPVEDFVGVINIVGEIGPSEEDSLFSTTYGYDHDLNISFVEEMMTAENNKGIILYIDSPGGTVYESDELYLKLMQYKNETGRPIWAYFASQACSGGYYIAMAADEIYANRNCTTGSIGVIISMVNAEGLYEKIGLETINLTSGENKAMDFSQEQLDIYQSIVDEAYDQFVGIVCDGRGLDEATVRKLADGRIYTAKQALDHKLIDNIGLYEDFMSDLEKEWDLDGWTTYYDPQDVEADVFGGMFAAIYDLIPRSDAEIGERIVNSKRSGVPMYYVQ